jgi:hypothetical protein
MTEAIKTGTILIAEGLILPTSLQFESEPYTPGWRVVKNLDSYGANHRIGQAGWNFFYLAGLLQASVFGFDEEKATRKAIKQVIASRRSKYFNCLEITQVAGKRFLGLPYVSLSAHSRHIQKTAILFEE